MKKQLALGVALALATSLATAGSAQISSAGQVSTVEYRDGGLLRMSATENSYMLVRDNKMYMVNGAPGQEMVIDASAILGAIGSAVPQINPTATEVASLDKTGRTESVAGIEGEVWIINYVDGDGNSQSEEMVVSKEPRVTEFRGAMEAFARTLVTSMGRNPDELDAMEETLRDEDVGMLRFGNFMRVVSLSEDEVAASRFELPAAPVDMSNLGNMFNQAIGGGASGN